MPLSSMTGFARAEAASSTERWTWEVRSVNGRGLEMRFRLPPGLDFIEPELRKATSELFSRGSVNASLAVTRDTGGTSLRLNREALNDAIGMIEAIRMRIDCEKPRAEGILALRGVVEADDALDDDEARKARGAAFVSTYREAALALKASRDAEGTTLAAVVSRQVDEIERLVQAARDNAADSLGALRDRLKQQLSELLVGSVPEERLAQEAALLAVRADIREELDRLDAHIGASRVLLADKEAVGRRFDFLTQEFNREANTLCSKAQDMTLKTLGIDLKTTIDRMREQVQNIE